jgi:hypothetical protein
VRWAGCWSLLAIGFQKTEFDELAQRIPNAESLMQEVKLRGIVTGPLDDIDDYDAALSSLGMGQPWLLSLRRPHSSTCART